MTVPIEVVSGVGGLSVYINGYRVAGVKPWGGGRVVASLKAEVRHIRTSLAKLDRPSRKR